MPVSLAAGVDEAASFGLDFRSIRVASTVRSHKRLPLFKSKHTTKHRVSSYPVRKTRLSQTTGEECPAGTAVRHVRFFIGPNSTGRSRDSDTPEPFGPQSAANSERLHRCSPRCQGRV